MKYSTKKLNTLEVELWFNSKEMNLEARLWETWGVGGGLSVPAIVCVCALYFLVGGVNKHKGLYSNHPLWSSPIRFSRYHSIVIRQ